MSEPSMKDSGERRQFKTGAVRDRGDFKPRPDLISPHAQLREGAWLAKGAEKYKVRNWEAGMPISECVASLCRHIEAYKLGMRDEDHMAAIRTNAGFILHYEEEVKAGRLPASLDDMPHYVSPHPLAVVSEVYPMNAIEATSPQASGLRPRPFPVMSEVPCNYERGVEADTAAEALASGDPWRARAVLQRIVPQPRPFTVYLCGPITGKPIDRLWRQMTTNDLAYHGIKTLDPLRGKDCTKIGNNGLSYQGNLASVEMAARDKGDVDVCDMVFAHFPYMPPRQSVGSLMEMGAAAIGLNKPVLLCTYLDEFNDHLFCRKFCVIEKIFGSALNRIVEIATAARR